MRSESEQARHAGRVATRRWSLRVWLCAGLMTMLGAAQAASPAITGPSAYGDWRSDFPGKRRHIRPSDLPEPRATPSSANVSRLVPRPDQAWPKVPEGFKVDALLTGLDGPRQMRRAPNGDLFIAESSASRVRVLPAKAADGAGAERADIYVQNLPARPYGLAFYPPGAEPQFLYVATEREVLRFPYRSGDRQARGEAQIVVPNLPAGGHWTRDLAFTPDGKTLLVSVGSRSNDAEGGVGSERRRAAILAFNVDGSDGRVYASGLRNPVSLAVHTRTGDVWTTVNERDGYGDDLPPDYVTRVKPGGFYGWPWYYIGQHVDPSHADTLPTSLPGSLQTPDVLLQPHSAPLGLAIYEGKQFPPDYLGDGFVALHGSWNRAKRTGYKVVRIPARDGQPTGEYEDFMTGLVTDEGEVWGRPVGVAVTAAGALLVSDDGSGTVWRVRYKVQP